MNRQTYRALVTPDGPYWSIDVPAVRRTTQAADVSEVPVVAQELVCLMLDVGPEQVEIVVEDETPVTSQA